MQAFKGDIIAAVKRVINLDIIFIGLVFIILNFNLNFNEVTIGLIPNFVGYILIIKGIKEVQNFEEYFKKAIPVSVIMAVYSFVVWVMNILAVETSEVVMLMVGIFTSILALYVKWVIIKGIALIEDKEKYDLYSDKLKILWFIMVVVDLFFYLSMYAIILEFIYIIVSFVVTLLFLFSFNKTRKQYNKILP